MAEEMGRAELGDPRRCARVSSVVAALARRPDVGFPQAMDDDSALEGLYRLLNNERVKPEAVLGAHFEATAERCRGLERVLVVHDSTDFAFKRREPPKDLGKLKNGARGFVGHFSLVLDPAREGLPAGLIAFEAINRVGELKKTQGKTKRAKADDRESLRWSRGARAAQELLTAEGREIIHVADREADAYEFMADVLQSGGDFVVRVHHDRRLAQGESKLSEQLRRFPILLRREVPISSRPTPKTPSKRKLFPERMGRVAQLEVVAGSVTLRRPESCKTGPKRLQLNAVEVREPTPPEGEPAIHWRLLTSLEVTTEDQVAAAVDTYGMRWVIEEFFKAFKTGCAFTKRQLDSFDALLTALALLAPVAWRLLLLRTFSRVSPKAPATAVLTQTEVLVLRRFAKRPLPEEPTLQEASWAVAGLGGHLKRNGPPGWQTLARGMQTLALMTAGWEAATSDQS